MRKQGAATDQQAAAAAEAEERTLWGARERYVASSFRVYCLCLVYLHGFQHLPPVHNFAKHTSMGAGTRGCYPFKGKLRGTASSAKDNTHHREK